MYLSVNPGNGDDFNLHTNAIIDGEAYACPLNNGDTWTIGVKGKNSGDATLFLSSARVAELAAIIAPQFGCGQSKPAAECLKEISSKDIIAELAERATSGRLD